MENTLKIASKATKLYFEPLLWIKKSCENIIQKITNEPKKKAEEKSSLYHEIDKLIKNQDEVLFRLKNYQGEFDKELFVNIHHQIHDLNKEINIKNLVKNLSNAVKSLNAIEIKFEDANYRILLREKEIQEIDTLEKKYVERIKKSTEQNELLEILIVESILNNIKDLSSSTSDEIESTDSGIKAT